MRFDRVEKLFGEDFKKLQSAKILLLGAGGVGGMALDALYRSGVSHITVVDKDIFDETNQNRQIGSESGLGQKKVFHLATLYPNITPICTQITKEWLVDFPIDNYDVILDAIDDIPIKVELIIHHYKKLICAGGSAKRIDPTLIQYINIWETHNDPFIRKIRTELKKRKFNKKFKIIFSSELPKCTTLGSFIGVTGAFGLTMASLAIQKIISNNELK